MKNSNFKRILSTVLFVALVLMTVFAISACKKEHVHDLDVVTVEPTCTKDGSKTTTCLDPECDFKEVETLPAKGHDFDTLKGLEPTCTEDGYTDYKVCSVCDVIEGYTTLEATGHTPGEPMMENIVEPTCTEKGSYDYIVLCADCGEELDNHKESISATGHNMQTVEAKSSTCYEIGWLEHSACANNGCDYKENYIEIEMYPHFWSDHATLLATEAPSCEEIGYNYFGVVCTNDACGAVKDGTIYSEEIPALGHDIVNHDAKAPDCENIGWDAYETCGRKGCEYSTYNELPALGHTPGEVVVENIVEATCTVRASHDEVIYCTVCSKELERNKVVGDALGHVYVDHDAKDPDCENIGWDAYQTCDREGCGYTSYVEIPALGHISRMVGEPFITVEPTCTEEGECQAYVFCDRCEAQLENAKFVIDAVGHNYVIEVAKLESTCTEKGYEAHKLCSKCSEPDNFVEILAKGHTLVAHEAKAPTCTEIGNEAYDTCSACDYTTYAAIDANGHSMVYLDAVAPNCTDTGLTAGQYCVNCDDCTVNQVVVAPLGHNTDANGLCATCGNRMSLNLSITADGIVTGMGGCTDKNVIIPDYINGVKVVGIAKGAFKNNSNIESLVIPSTVKTVDSEAFFGCVKLKSVVIGDGVEHIDSFAFFGCTRLSTVTMGSGVKSIGNSAFASCGISTVYYNGTAADWNKIQIGLNKELASATIYYI